MAVEVNTREIEHILSHVPRSTLFSLKLDGEADTTVLVRGLDRKPTTGELYHVDFYRVSMTHTLKTEVPLVLDGEAPAVREFDAVVLQTMNMLAVECLPADIPAQLLVPLERLQAIDDAIKVGDLDLPRGVRSLIDEGELVAKAAAPTVTEPEPEVAEAPAEAEGEEAAAGATEASVEAESASEADAEKS
jgi:large subunit ribosomal protein L25